MRTPLNTMTSPFSEYQSADDQLSKTILDITEDDSINPIVNDTYNKNENENLNLTPGENIENSEISQVPLDPSHRGDLTAPPSDWLCAQAVLVERDQPSNSGDLQHNVSPTRRELQAELLVESLKRDHEVLETTLEHERETKDKKISYLKRRIKYLVLALICTNGIFVPLFTFFYVTRSGPFPETSNSTSTEPPTQSPTGKPIESFESNQELFRAVDEWLAGQDTSDSELAGMYGFPIGQWDVSNITDFSSLFDACVDCTVTNGRNAYASTFNADISMWNVSSAQRMVYMFADDVSFNGDMSYWDVSSVTQMKGMFLLAKAFTGIGVGSWNVSSVSAMSEMFSGADVFDQDLSTWDVSSVTDMTDMFASAAKFTGAGLSSWNVANVKIMSGMFFGAYAFDQDLSTWDVSDVLLMDSMFQDADAFEGVGLSLWDVSQVTDMNYMFSGSKLDVNLSTWDVSSVTNINYMFYDNQFFTGNGLATWNVSRAVDISGMFWKASSFDQNLCAWGPLLPPNAKVENIFQGTNCPEQTDPNLTASPPGPFCYTCA